MDLDYNQIRDNLLNTLTIRELCSLCNIIGKETNLKVIHGNIKESLDPENAVDPLFCIELQKKVDDKVFSMYELITLSHAVIDKKISLF